MIRDGKECSSRRSRTGAGTARGRKGPEWRADPEIRAIRALAWAALLGACASGGDAVCEAWTASPSCTLPPLAIAAVPLEETQVAGVEPAIDAHGALLLAVSIGTESGPRVRVLEEQSAGLVSRAWPGDLDRVVDMPALAVGPGGEAAVAIRAGSDGANADVLVATRDGLGSWREPMRSEPASLPPRAYEPRVAFTPSGTLVLVVNQGAASRTGYGVRVCEAASADEPLDCPASADDVLSLATFFSNRPRPALDARGGGVISWYQSLGGPLRCFVSTRTSESEPFALVTEADTVSIASTPVDSGAPPDAASSAGGTSAVAWGQEDGRGGVAVFVAIRRPDGSIERPASLDDRISVGDQVARQVSVAAGADDALFVVWAGRGTDAAEHVWRARIAPGARTADAEVELVSSRELDASAPAIAISPRGEVAIAYVEHAAGSERLWLRRGATDGSLAAPERIAESVRVGGPALAFGSATRRFALAWVDADGAHVAATAR